MVSIAGAMLASCDRASDGEAGPAALLSPEAEAIFERMVWIGDAPPPTIDEAAAWSGVDPPADSAAVEAAVGSLAGDLLTSFELDPLAGRLLVDTSERPIERGPDLTDEQALRAGVTAVLEAMGAPADQIELVVGGTSAVGASSGDEPTAEIVDKTVYVQRRVLGLVTGDSGSASFERTGPLINLRCTWRRLDYDASTLSVDGLASEEAVMAELAERMAADDFELEPTLTELQVSARYDAIEPAEPTGDTWTLHPLGTVAIIDSRGGTIPSLGFDLAAD